MATMSLEEKNATGTTVQRAPGVSVLEQTGEVLKQAYCRECQDYYIYVKDPGTLRICRQLVDNEVWESHSYKHQKSKRVIKLRCKTELGLTGTEKT